MSGFLRFLDVNICFSIFPAVIWRKHKHGFMRRNKIERGKDEELTLAGHHKFWAGGCWSSWKNCHALQPNKIYELQNQYQEYPHILLSLRLGFKTVQYSLCPLGKGWESCGLKKNDIIDINYFNWPIQLNIPPTVCVNISKKRNNKNWQSLATPSFCSLNNFSKPCLMSTNEDQCWPWWGMET